MAFKLVPIQGVVCYTTQCSLIQWMNALKKTKKLEFVKHKNKAKLYEHNIKTKNDGK